MAVPIRGLIVSTGLSGRLRAYRAIRAIITLQAPARLELILIRGPRLVLILIRKFLTHSGDLG